MARLHYADEGEGPLVLMIHGNPTWSVLYRDLIEGLRGQYRCIAVDLAGFGPGFSFKPEDQARLVAGFLDRLNLNDVTLGAHDWGGPVGLGAAMMTGRISRLCLGNTWAWPLNSDFHFEWFSKLMGGPIGRFGSERYLAFVNLVMPSAMRRHKLSAQELDLYRAPFREVQSRPSPTIFTP
jgi:haloalkane dehalogenase